MSLSTEQLRELVLNKGTLKPEEFDAFLDYSQKNHQSLEEILISKKTLTDQEIGRATAQQLNLPYVELNKLDVPDEVITVIPEDVAKKRQIIAFARDDNGLRVATSNSENTLLLEMLSKKVGVQIFAYYATPSDINQALSFYNTNIQKLFDKLLEEDDGKMITTVAHDPPVAKMVDTLIDSAYKKKASDIHIEPLEKDLLVRFRIDGLLHDVLVLPKTIHSRIVNRVKVMSKLRTDEHLSAQDGKIRMELATTKIDLRVSILPIADGEKIVMSLLPSEIDFITLEDLGFRKNDLDKVVRAFSKPYGMIICTGPTGSGKTTTIYTILRYINVREQNITSIEDPIEYRMKGTNQIQVNEKTNLTFANGLRSILRQDPDCIFVGEIRDGETAGIAVNAALTGHLVLTTLHTNNASATLPRLFDMKIEPFLAASTVNLIIGQRLLRKICERCKQEQQLSLEELQKNLSPQIVEKIIKIAKNENPIKVYKGQGCRACHQTGYQGRVGVYEVLEVTKHLRSLIANKQESQILEDAAIKEGMTLMLDDGINKMLAGITTLEEVIRVTRTGD